MSAETDLQAAAGKLMKIPYDIEVFCVGATYTTDRTNAIAALIPDMMPAQQNAIESMHQLLYGTRGAYVPAAQAWLPAYGRLKSYVDTSLQGIFLRLFEYAGTGGFTIKSRGFTFATPAAGGANVGSGSVNRLTTDRYGYPIENGSPEAKSMVCVADEHNGATRHAEQFTLRGSPISRVVFPWPTQGQQGALTVLSAYAQRYVTNPSFEQYDSSSSAFTGWNVNGAWANVARSTNYYKDVLPNTPPYSLVFNASEIIYQTWSAQSINWPWNVPLYAQLAWKRLGSATGTLKLTIGAITVTVDVSTGTNGVWNILRFPASGSMKNAWFLNWNTSNAAATPATGPFIKIEMNTLAVGTIEIDDVICGPWTAFDGTYYAVAGGPVPFLRDDSYTWTDTATEGAKIQTAIVKGLGGYFPAVGGGAETWVDP